MLRLDAATSALVVIDLETKIVAMDLAPYSSNEVVTNCVALADAMRAAGAAVVFVHVDLNDEPYPPVDKPRPEPSQRLPEADSDFVPAVKTEPTDKVILKRQFGAFWQTDLHEYLQAKGIRTLVLGGIDTNMGVESTARDAFDRRYAVVCVEDAMSSMTTEMHEFAIEKIFPLIARVRTTREVVAAFA